MELIIGMQYPDATVNVDHTDLEYKLYRYDIVRKRSHVYDNTALYKMGNRAFYSAATDGFGRHLKMRKSSSSSKLHQVIPMFGGIHACDNTYDTDCRMLLIYVDPDTGHIVEVKQNLLYEQLNQAQPRSDEVDRVIYNCTSFVNVCEEDTGGFFASYGGIKQGSADATEVQTSPLNDFTDYDFTNDLFIFNPNSHTFTKLDMTDIAPIRIGHSWVKLGDSIYTFGGGKVASLLDYSNMVLSYKNSSQIYLAGTEPSTSFGSIIDDGGQYYSAKAVTWYMGQENYLVGKSSNCSWGEFDSTRSRSCAGKDGWLRRQGDIYAVIRRLYLNVYGKSHARIVIIASGLNKVIYENENQSFPCVIDLTGKADRNYIYIYIDLPENMGVYEMRADYTW